MAPVKAGNSATSPGNSFLYLITPHGEKLFMAYAKYLFRLKSSIIQSLSISKQQICNKTQEKPVYQKSCHLITITPSHKQHYLLGNANVTSSLNHLKESKATLLLNFHGIIPMGLCISSEADRIYSINIYRAYSRLSDFISRNTNNIYISTGFLITSPEEII